MSQPKSRLRELRQQHKLSLGQLALRTGIHRSHIYKIEHGHRVGTADVLMRLAQYFGCSLEELLNSQDEQTTAEQSALPKNTALGSQGSENVAHV